MKAEEVLDKVFAEAGINKGWLPESKEAVVKAMQEFASEKCKEQRELCFKQMKHQKFGIYGAKKDAILNAPEPNND